MVKLYCKLCGEYVGEFWSQLDQHIIDKHQEVWFAFLKSNAKIIVEGE